MKPIIVITSLPNDTEAKKLAKHLLEEKLVACAQIRAEMTSIYEWKGKIETSQEVALHLKTFQRHYPIIEKAIKDHHSYDVPEIIAIEIDNISDEYLVWMNSVLG